MALIGNEMEYAKKILTGAVKEKNLFKALVMLTKYYYFEMSMDVKDIEKNLRMYIKAMGDNIDDETLENIIKSNTSSKTNINKLDKMIGIIKRDKTKYMILICILAIALESIEPCIASETYSFEAGLNNSCNQIIDLLLVIAQYVFLGLGLKNLITVAISGGSFRDMVSESSQFLLGYVFIKIYPTIFEIFSQIKF